MRSPYHLTVAALLCLVLSMPAGAQSPADFYRGKAIDLFVGYPPGAGFDAYGRALAQHMGRHIPGAPSIVVRNMPGASSLKALQHIAGTAPRDGTAIGLFNPNLVSLSLLEPKTVDVDFSKLTWIGNMSSDTRACLVMARTGIARLDDLKTKRIVIGSTAQGGGTLHGSILRELYGENVRIVIGYPSNADLWVAMERGEVDANCTGWGIIPVKKPEWVRDKTVNVLVQFALTPDKLLPDVPLIYDSGLAPELKDVVAFLTHADAITRPVVAPPGVPSDRARALQQAFMATLRDAELLAFAQKAGLEIDPVPAEEVARIVELIRRTPAAAVERARSFVK